MSRPRKTFISDAYAARQACFASLGIAKFIRPMAHLKGHINAAITAAQKQFAEDEDALHKRYEELAQIVRRHRVLANGGNGPWLNAYARYYHNGGLV